MLDANDPEPRVTLDDKELLNEFDEAKFDAYKVKTFAFNLLKARFFLDNYIVHHSNEDDSYGNNPWKLQVLTKKDKETTPENLCSDNKLQEKLVHLLSMFEVSYTAKQYKNYLFDCLDWLMEDDSKNLSTYADFVENLANEYLEPYAKELENSARIPLFVFNYLDYKIWKLYAEQLRGQEYKEKDPRRIQFFENLGCSDFGLDIFQKFYFSRTRRSLEHYFPQANANKEGVPNDKQINCFGNFAMIGAEANSSGSNWSPKAKLDHYLDPSGKINQISVASLKFMIMMQICKDHKKWEREEIQEHQSKMLAILGLTEEKVGC
jgi:hypothetical protein